MFKKRQIKKQNVDIEFERNENRVENTNSSEEEDIVVVVAKAVKKKVKQNYLYEDVEELKDNVKDLIDAEMEDFKYKSNANLTGNRRDLATVYNEIDTEETVDAHAIALKRMEISQQIRDGKLSADVYRGKNYTTQYTQKSDESIRNSKFTGSMGPVRAPANVRMTCRFDYDPSLCKDYHDTGYCVFGDSCLYLHDRGDYKNGQEQEQEWQREQKRKQKALQNGEDEDSEAEEVSTKLNEFYVPKICQICEGKLRNPVKTLCDHYFCEDCALKKYSTSKTCAVCDRNTQGVFQDAQTIIMKLQKERKEEKIRLKKAASSRSALNLLQDSEESDDNFNQNNDIFDQKKQKKLKQKTQLSVERVFIDDNGIEITETVMQENQQNSFDQKDSESHSDHSNQDNHNEADTREEQRRDDKEENKRLTQDKGQHNGQQQSDDQNMMLAINQLKKKKDKRKSFKPSASDWAI